MTLYDAVCTMIIQDPTLVLDINTFEEELCDMFEEQIEEHCTVSVFGAEYSMSPLDLYRFNPTLASQIWDEFFSDEIYDHIYEHETSSGAQGLFHDSLPRWTTSKNSLTMTPMRTPL